MRKVNILKKEPRERDKTEKNEVENYKLNDGMLYRIVDVGDSQRELYVVPRVMQKMIVIRNHDLKDHGGVERTLNRIREFFDFQKMKQYIKIMSKPKPSNVI